MDAAAKIVRTARRMSAAGLVAGSAGNISVRLDDGGALITPTRLAYDAMEASDLVRIDSQGAVVAGHRSPSREWPMHLALYASRPEVGAVVHSHSPHAVAWSFLDVDLARTTEELLDLGGPIRTAAAAPPGSRRLAAAVATAIGDRRAVLMARHGVVGVGPDVHAALQSCQLVEHQAQVELLLRAVEVQTA